MIKTMNETITITRSTYDLIRWYVDLLNEISDRYISNDKTVNSEITHIQLARWGSAHRIQEAIDGNVKGLVDDICGAIDSLAMLNDLQN